MADETDKPAAAAAPSGPKPPAQDICERLLALRDAQAAIGDRLGAIVASIHGRAVQTVPRPPRDVGTGEPFGRLFPALLRLVADLEAEAKRIAAQADELDRAL